ncbi:acyl transferase/acyl hydrolase/lysophospholipase [Xylariaceae sp. FL0255]|nr:acyl transferase/acyl hydrolase/lysophospholipase [Xylariaceae sp. FL0255]
MTHSRCYSRRSPNRAYVAGSLNQGSGPSLGMRYSLSRLLEVLSYAACVNQLKFERLVEETKPRLVDEARLHMGKIDNIKDGIERLTKIFEPHAAAQALLASSKEREEQLIIPKLPMTRPGPLETPKIRVLVIDGGGIRGLSSLYILKSLMERINEQRETMNLLPTNKPCLIFDMIGGTGTGGLIAIMLGRLRMEIDECIAAYKNIMSGLPVLHESMPPLDTHGLDKALDQAFGRPGNEKFIDSKAMCDVFAEIEYTNGYKERPSTWARKPPDSVRTIQQTALATLAVPRIFKPLWEGVHGRSPSQGNLIEAARDAIQDRWEVGENNIGHWLETQLGCFVSIGAGIQPQMHFRRGGPKMLADIIDNIAEWIKERYAPLNGVAAKLGDRYFRFDLPEPTYLDLVNECDESIKIATDTKLYLETCRNDLKQCVSTLLQDPILFQIATEIDHGQVYWNRGSNGQIKVSTLDSILLTVSTYVCISMTYSVAFGIEIHQQYDVNKENLDDYVELGTFWLNKAERTAKCLHNWPLEKRKQLEKVTVVELFLERDKLMRDDVLKIERSETKRERLEGLRQKTQNLLTKIRLTEDDILEERLENLRTKLEAELEQICFASWNDQPGCHQLPLNVRSCLIASLAGVILSIAVFITLFLVKISALGISKSIPGLESILIAILWITIWIPLILAAITSRF